MRGVGGGVARGGLAPHGLSQLWQPCGLTGEACSDKPAESVAGFEACSLQRARGMRFEVASELAYSVGSPSTIIFNIHALRTTSQTVLEESLVIEPYLKHEEFVSSSGESRFVRLETGTLPNVKVAYRAKVDVAHEVLDTDALGQMPMHRLAHDVVPFLFPSRYCQSDRLGRLAYRNFGRYGAPYERVLAITDWVFENVEYVPGSTNAETSAYDTITQGAGVCRDFAHLSIALCRALNIPARYFTGYAYQLQPPDFHACFEAYIGGRWMLFDATRLAQLNGIVRIASGRDAADTSVATIFGQVALQEMSVSCELTDPSSDFKGIKQTDLGKSGVSLDLAA